MPLVSFPSTFIFSFQGGANDRHGMSPNLPHAPAAAVLVVVGAAAAVVVVVVVATAGVVAPVVAVVVATQLTQTRSCR